MADIKTYVDQISNAVYGEEVRSSIINALNKVNDDNNSYESIKTDILSAKDSIDTQVANFDAKVQSAKDATTALTNATSTGNTAKENLVTATNEANSAKTSLETATSQAKVAETSLEATTSAANTAKKESETAKANLEDSTKTANTTKSNLDSSITTANTTKTNLENSTSTANTAKTNLDLVIDSANTTKTNLESSVKTAQSAQSDLSGVITTANKTIEQIESDISTSTNLSNALDTKNGIASNNLTALDDANFNAKQILTGLDDVKAYLGYMDSDIAGVQIDYKNKTSQRLAGAYELNAGSDFDQFNMFGGRKRCNVADDGTIVAWYGDENFAEDGTMGQVMVYQPAFWYKVVPLEVETISDGEGYHIRKANYYVATRAKTGFKRHPLFYDKNGEEIDFALLSAYEGSIYDTSEEAYLLLDEQTMDVSADKFCSIAGAKPASGKTQNLTRPNVETLALNRGEDWHGDLIKAESANQLLMIIEMGMMNLQTAIANGVVSVSDTPNTENNSLVTGGTSALGNATGMADGTNGQASITYRGVENPWGNIWKHVYGINIYGNGSQKGGIPYICTDFNFAESKNSGNYESAGFTLNNGSGWVSAFGYGNEDYDWLFMPTECTGNSSLPVGDYEYITSNLNGYRIALLGGIWAYGADAGGFCWGLTNGVGVRFRSIGGRLVYVPTKATSASYDANISAFKQLMSA
jgi:hypothetical protein